jgi:hypothetical protein
MTAKKGSEEAAHQRSWWDQAVLVLTPVISGPRVSFWDILRDSWFTLDRRTLGFARVLLGFYLIGDLIRRTWDWEEMYSTRGVIPNHVNLWREGQWVFSLVNAFSTPGELWALWALMLATYICLFVGFKTKLMQVLSLVWITSLNNRIIPITNGGYAVQTLLLLWACFLPMGDRFSVDALLASLRRSRERTAADLNDRSAIDDPDTPDRYVSLIGFVLVIQLAAVYFFNVVHKTGPAWRNGTAVHYVLYVDQMVTPLIAHTRELLPKPILLFMGKATMAFESAIPVCILCPLARPWARRLAIVMMNALHIAFGTTFVLGPFSWGLCVFSTMLLGREDWEMAIATMRRAHRARVVRFDPASAGALFACRLLKRMDRFELLTFEEAPGVRGLAVKGPGGAELRGAAALADVVAALPLGPAVAWALRLPGIRGAITALMEALHRQSAARALGIRIPAHAGGPGGPPPAPLRRLGGKTLAALREAAILILLFAAVNRGMLEMWVINRRIRVPEPLGFITNRLRFLQGWYMFSPNPVMVDGNIAVDALTVDGRHIDPFTGKEPVLDIKNIKSFRHNQIWCDYFRRMGEQGNAPYREAMKEYIFRYPERTGRIEDTIVSGDVYWVSDWNPKWGTTESYGQEKKKLFSFVNPKARAQVGEMPALAPREEKHEAAPQPSPVQAPSD